MATFQYQAHRADQTLVEGHIDADDLKSALLSLETQGLIVSSIHQFEIAEAQTDAPPVVSSPAHPPEAEQLALRRQINHVLKMGKPLVPALLAYAQELPPGRRRRLRRIANQLEQGHDPSHELAADQIDEAWIPLLSASVSSGDPSQILSGLIDESHRAGDLRRQFASALAYPLLLLGISFGLLLLITWWITPTFQEIFADFGTELPATTELVLSISATIRKSRGLVILIPALGLVAMIMFLGIGPRSEYRDWILHRIPVFGSTVRLSDRARFTRYLADLIAAKVNVADALRISARNTGQTELRREANQLATEIDLGNANLSESLPDRRSLPHTVIHALQLQDKPEAAALILRELSLMYDQQTRNRLAWTSSLIEPVFIVFLGMAVGFYVVALFMPLISLIQNLT